jgi:hypothetical protein
MPLPQRLRHSVRTLSPKELKELRALLDQLLQHPEESPSRTPRTTKRHYTYRREYVRCGKQGCKCATGQGHGPYWYAYWKEGGTLKKKYLGKSRKR